MGFPARSYSKSCALWQLDNLYHLHLIGIAEYVVEYARIVNTSEE